MKNKVLLMCGSHMRHMYIAEKLYNEDRLAGLVIEERENFIPVPPDELSNRDRDNFILHFSRRDKAEKRFFGNVRQDEILKQIPYMNVNQESLNDDSTVEFIKKIPADILLTYGVHKLEDKTIDIYSEKSFNIHGGLSPWYRGNITLFWPFYFLKPNWAGMTVHRLTQRLDAGDILHHSVPKLAYGDRMHDVACKAVVQVAEDICGILNCLDEGKKLVCTKQKNAGKLFLSCDWTPQMLRVIYELYDDKLVDLFLDGKLEKVTPNLVNYFENIDN